MSDNASNIINISDKPKLTTDKGSICLGGAWELAPYLPMLTDKQCVKSNVTVPGWSAEPNNPDYCIAPIGQKCCNPYTYNGKSVCMAGFGAANYDEKAMKEWKASCIVPPELFDGNITYVDFMPTPPPSSATAPAAVAATPTPANCTKCSDGMFACTNLPESKLLKSNRTIPANTDSLLRNYMNETYDSATPSYTLEGKSYWWAQGGGCIQQCPTGWYRDNNDKKCYQICSSNSQARNADGSCICGKEEPNKSCYSGFTCVNNTCTRP
jgi:hypothetical protein